MQQRPDVYNDPRIQRLLSGEQEPASDVQRFLVERIVDSIARGKELAMKISREEALLNSFLQERTRLTNVMTADLMSLSKLVYALQSIQDGEESSD